MKGPLIASLSIMPENSDYALRQKERPDPPELQDMETTFLTAAFFEITGLT